MPNDDNKATNRAQMRKAILDQASTILAQEGPHALSMRKLSEKVGASTIVLYTYFRNKQDILDELYREGFTRLRQDLEIVEFGLDPMEYVMQLGRAYRKSAIGNSTYYQIMFSQCVPGFMPSLTSLETSQQCFQVLRQGVQHCVDAGLVLPASASETAQVLWGTLHGIISLELFGYLGASQLGEACLERAIQTIKAGLSAGSSGASTKNLRPSH